MNDLIGKTVRVDADGETFTVAADGEFEGTILSVEDDQAEVRFMDVARAAIALCCFR